jgi:hypothetical protein
LRAARGRLGHYWATALLPQPGGFEGLRAIQKVLLPDHQPPSELEELKYLLAYGHAAARSVSPLPSRDEKPVSEIEDLLGVPPDVLECIEEPRSRRQPHESVGEQAVKGGKADVQALIQAPALTRFSLKKGARFGSRARSRRSPATSSAQYPALP